MSQSFSPYSKQAAVAFRETRTTNLPTNAAGYTSTYTARSLSNDFNIRTTLNTQCQHPSDAHFHPRPISAGSISYLPSTSDSGAINNTKSSQQQHGLGSSSTLWDSSRLHHHNKDVALPEQPVEDPGVSHDRDLTTRNLSLAALVLGWVVSITSLSIGIYIVRAGPIELPGHFVDRNVAIGTVTFTWTNHTRPGKHPYYINDHRVFQVPEAVMIIVPLLMTFTLTLVLDSINSIHALSLRWALWREGRPMFNSNIRLFTSSKYHWPNSWPANTVSAIALVVAYGGISLLTFNVYIIGKYLKDGNIDPNVAGPRYFIDFNAWGLIGVGAGILLQAIISTSCVFYRKGLIGTWSSNPLATARACRLQNGTGNIAIAGKATCSVMTTANSTTMLHAYVDKDSAEVPPSDRTHSNYALTNGVQYSVSRPRTKQPSIRSQVPRAQQIVKLVWFNFAIFTVLVIIIGFVAKNSESISSRFVYEASGRLDFLAYLQNFGQVWHYYTERFYSGRKDWLGLIIQSSILAVVLGTLHLVEILALMVRDEVIWRKGTSRNGVRPDARTILQNASVWQCWAMLAFKSVTPWVFSYSFTCNVGIFVSLIPLAILTTFFLLLGIFAEGLMRWRPKGSQPATYGNIPALLSVVDDWEHHTIFWGEKVEPVNGGTGKAGTSGKRLADVKQNGLYTRLKADVES